MIETSSFNSAGRLLNELERCEWMVGMKLHQIENWALDIIERVRLGQPIEDSRVELKAGWIDADKAARRIAGHANAARGEPILWLIGVDEKQGVQGVKYEEFSTWFAKVKGQFDELPPSCMDISVPIDRNTITAILFETDRAPFVVKNSCYGQQRGGPVEYEVPWRDGTAVRTARRSDLIRLLSPLQMLPTIEVLKGELFCKMGSQGEAEISWHLSLQLYIYAQSDSTTVIPFHRSEATMEISSMLESTYFNYVKMGPPHSFYPGGPSSLLSLTINGTGDEIIISGPGRFHLNAGMGTPLMNLETNADACVRISLQPVNFEDKIVVETTLKRVPERDRNELARWDVE